MELARGRSPGARSQRLGTGEAVGAVETQSGPVPAPDRRPSPASERRVPACDLGEMALTPRPTGSRMADTVRGARRAQHRRASRSSSRSCSAPGWRLLIDRWLGTARGSSSDLLPLRPRRRRHQRLPDGRQVSEVAGRLDTGIWKLTHSSSRRAQRRHRRRGDDPRRAARAAGPQLALGVAGGAFLVGFSYWTLKRGVEALAAMVASAAGERPGRPAASRANCGNWCCGTLYSLFWRTL